jgi:hypothetical protein
MWEENKQYWNIYSHADYKDLHISLCLNEVESFSHYFVNGRYKPNVVCVTMKSGTSHYLMISFEEFKKNFFERGIS